MVEAKEEEKNSGKENLTKNKLWGSCQVHQRKLYIYTCNAFYAECDITYISAYT